MKISKLIKKFCKTCKKSTEHKVALAKARGRSSTHPLSRGSNKRIRLRGERRGAGNHGRYSKPTKPKRTGAKGSKKLNLKLTCNTCNKSSIRSGSRTKKVELI